MKGSYFITLLFLFSSICSYSAQDPYLIFFKEGSCHAEQKIVESEEFKREIPENIPFETIDCMALSTSEAMRVKEVYHIQELPRILLFDKKGQEIARYGFIGETPENLGKHIKESLQGIKDLEKAISQLDKLSMNSLELENCYRRALLLKQEKIAEAFLEKGVENNCLFFLLEKYRLCCEKKKDIASLREKIIALDPQNEKESLFSLALIDFQTLETFSPSKESVRPLEDYLARYGERDAKNRWRLEMMIAQFYLNYDEWNTSLQHAQLAWLQAPNHMKDEIGKCCDYIKAQLLTQSMDLADRTK